MNTQTLTRDELIEFQRKTGLTSVPSWAWDRVVPMEQVENYCFYSYKENTTSIQEVNLDNVVGAYHPNYADRTWIRMLLGLSRTDVNISDYIKTVAQAYEAFDHPRHECEMVSFNKYGKNYIIGTGHHRTCFAKFGERKIVKAKVTNYVFDHEAATANNFLKQYFRCVGETTHHFEFHSPSIIIMTCDRSELIAFYRYFSNMNMETKSAGKGILKKIDTWLFPDTKKTEAEITIRWTNTPTDSKVLARLMDVRKSIPC